MKWKKVARKLQSVGEAGYAFSALSAAARQWSRRANRN